MRPLLLVLLLLASPAFVLAAPVPPLPAPPPAPAAPMLPMLPGVNVQYLGDLPRDAYALAGHDHDDRYYTKAESDGRFLGVGATAADAAKLGGQPPSAYAPASHNHDTRYYTQAQSDARFARADGELSRITFVDEFFGNRLRPEIWTESGNGTTRFSFGYKGVVAIHSGNLPGNARRVEADFDGVGLSGDRNERLTIIDGIGSMGVSGTTNQTLEMGFVDGGVLVAGFRYDAGATASTWQTVTREYGDATGSQQVTTTPLVLDFGRTRTWDITFTHPPTWCCGVDVHFAVNGAEVAVHHLDGFTSRAIGFSAATKSATDRWLPIDLVEWGIDRRD
jgi:hypothetical protein